MGNVFFTADLHLGHKNIINYCDRPWAKDPRNPTPDETAEMSEQLVQNWNSVVGPEDTVYNIGDLSHCAKKKQLIELLTRLRGEHIFLRGNHDGLADEIYLEQPNLFYQYLPDPRHSASNVPGYFEGAINGQTIVMQHYAMREWHHCLRGVWHIFGHTHASLEPFGKSCDVGVDNAHTVIADSKRLSAPLNAFYRPIHFDELKVFMDRQPIGPHPKFEQYRPGHPELETTSVLEPSQRAGEEAGQ